MTKPLDLDVLLQNKTLKERNHYLQTRVDQLTVSRDMWKERAMTRWVEIRSLKSRVKRLEARARPRRPSSPPRTYTLEQWRQHDVIVRRIRSFADRDIV